MGMRSPARKSAEPSGRLKLVVVPAAQSPVPAPFAATVLMTQVLVAAPLCDPFGTGRGGPKRHPAFEQVRNLQAPPGQSAFELHALWWFVPPEHRFPPVSAGVVPLSVRAVPLHDTLVTVVPRSGMVDGSGVLTPAPPK